MVLFLALIESPVCCQRVKVIELNNPVILLTNVQFGTIFSYLQAKRADFSTDERIVVCALETHHHSNQIVDMQREK